MAVSVLTGLAFALAPAIRLGRPGALDALKEGARGGGSGRASGRFRNTLVAVELGLAMVLMVGAGLFVNSFLRLSNVDPGFDPDNAITMAVNLNSSYEGTEAQGTYFRQLTDGLSAIPGTRAVAYTSVLPFGGDRFVRGITLEGREADPASPDVSDYSITGPGFFATMEIELVAGREFTYQDDASAEPVLMVNEAFVRRYWPGEDAVGRRVGMGRGDPQWHTVIGVAADIHRNGLDRPADIEMFLTPLQQGLESAHVVLRTDRDIG